MRNVNQSKFDFSDAEKIFSLEVCANRFLDVEKLIYTKPSFCSIPCHLTSSDASQVLNIPVLNLAKTLSERGHHILLHFPGRYLQRWEVLKILDVVKGMGLRNILALQGDGGGVILKREVDFPHAIDLVSFIRQHYGNYFSVGVAAYPGGHPECNDEVYEIDYLKAKVRAGADYIVTQATFDYETLMQFLRKCKEGNIGVPILAGLYVFDTCAALKRMRSMCGIKVPTLVWDVVSRNKNDSKAISKFSLFHHAEIIRKVFAERKYAVAGVHIFTLNNLDHAEELAKMLGLRNFYIERPLGRKKMYKY